MGNISEIWHLKMIRGAIINSPAHSTGTHEHILIHQGTLMMRFNEDQTVLLEPGISMRSPVIFPTLISAWKAS